MTSPQPPSAPQHGIRVYPAFFGQQWDKPDGTTVTLEEDGVVLELLIDGKAVAARYSTAESAIELARFLVTAAGQVQAQRVNDDGKRPSGLDRLKAFDQAWKGQQ